MSFERLGLIAPLQRALRDAGYDRPTPIQERAIGPALEGRDLFGCAQTGTGKTAAFALPILQRMAAAPAPVGRRPTRVLVLTPTRELAAQVTESFRTYGRFLPLTSTVIFGGVPERPQVEALRRGIDVLVATPGRLLDLMGQGHVDLGRVEVLVLDEADRMLDMGFIHDIRRIVAVVPRRRQTLFFSATVPREIRELARGLLSDPVEVSVTPQSTAAETVDQCLYFVPKARKPALLRHLLADPAITRALVFTRTKHGADRVAKALHKAEVRAEAIHGNKSQNARTRALRSFSTGGTRVLVASDIASRGLDIDLVSHVVNYDLPNEPETYVHRIGRTGRAGALGAAISFCDREERAYLRDIERLIGRKVRVVEHPFIASAEEEAAELADAETQRGGGGGRGRPGRGGGGGGGRGGRGGPQRQGDGDRRQGGRGHGGQGDRRHDGRAPSDGRGPGGQGDGPPSDGRGQHERRGDDRRREHSGRAPRPGHHHPVGAGRPAERPASGRPASGRHAHEAPRREGPRDPRGGARPARGDDRGPSRGGPR